MNDMIKDNDVSNRATNDKFVAFKLGASLPVDLYEVESGLVDDNLDDAIRHSHVYSWVLTGIYRYRDSQYDELVAIVYFTTVFERSER